MDFSQFAALIQSAKVGVDLLGVGIEARDQTKISEATSQLQESVTRAYGATIEIQAKYLASIEKCAALLEENLALRDRVADLAKRAAEIDRYSLAEIAPGAHALLIKPEHQGTEPIHYLCQPCMSKGVKAVLSRFDRFRMPAWRCPNCNNEYPPRNVAGGAMVQVRRG